MQQIPPQLRTLLLCVEKHVLDLTHPIWSFNNVWIRFIDFLVMISSQHGRGNLNARAAQERIVEALNIYRALNSLFESSPPAWQYECVHCATFIPIVAYKHVYHSITAAQLWEAMRSATILLFDIVLKAMSSCTEQASLDFNSEDTVYAQSSARILNETAIEAIAAAPEHLSDIFSTLMSPHRSAPTFGQTYWQDAQTDQNGLFYEMGVSDQVVPNVVLNGLWLIHWSSYFGASCDTVDHDVRSYLVGILEHIGGCGNVGHIRELATELRAKVSN